MPGRFSTKSLLIGGGVVAVLVIGGVSAVALSGNSKKSTPVASNPAPTTSAATTSASPTPTPKPTPKPVAATNPLTGVGPVPTTALLAVKIDDTENGRPSVNLDKADLVYIEQAEGGLTRMVALFGTNHPIVEPVRSVRASDAELLSQYGKIALVASGGGGDSLTTLDASIVKGVINDRGAAGFGRDGNRPAPYNLTADLAQIAAHSGTAAPKAGGFHFSSATAQLAHDPAGATVNTVVGSTSVTFVYDPSLRKYVRTIDGQRLSAADGNLIATPNVLVQLCNVTTNPGDVDVNGNPSQFTHSVGSGKAVLFRNGKRVTGTWSRPSVTSPTTFVDASGHAMLLAPGGAFIVLATTGAPV